MQCRVWGFLSLLSLLSSINSAQAVFSQNQKLADYKQLVTTVEQSYAPLHLKQKTIGLDWSSYVNDFKERVRRTSSDSEFYQIMTQFLVGLQDGHVSVSVPSTYQGSLGFVCDYIENKVVIDSINTKVLPLEVFPFQRGDRLLAIGGESVEDLLKKMQQLTSTGYEVSAKRLAAAYLTYRRESRGFEVPKGITTVTILPQGSSTPVTVSVTWITKGQQILNIEDSLARSDRGDQNNSSLQQQLQALSLFDLALPKEKIRDIAQVGLADIGSEKSMFTLPSDAVQIPEIPFTAVTFVRRGKTIGILRLSEFDNQHLVHDFGLALIEMQKKVDVLVVDQTNNPGGKVSSVSTIFSYFVDRSTPDVKYRLRPSRSWLDKFESLNQEVDNSLAVDPRDSLSNVLKPRFRYLETMVRSSMENSQFLSEPMSLDLLGGLGVIQPNPAIQFTKPVLLLINELDFSGGDVFPALMKDSGRAVLFGHRTSGAGGNVGSYGPLTNSYLKFRLTESLIVRQNGEFIENAGVEPDIHYSITQKDFVDGYSDYVNTFTCAALKLVNTECAEANPALPQ